MYESPGLTDEFKPDSVGSETLASNPDAQIYWICWLANRLTCGQPQALRRISEDVRLRITQLLNNAVDVYLMVLHREKQAMMVAEQAGRPETSVQTGPVPRAENAGSQGAGPCLFRFCSGDQRFELFRRHATWFTVLHDNGVITHTAFGFQRFRYSLTHANHDFLTMRFKIFQCSTLLSICPNRSAFRTIRSAPAC